MLLRERKIGNRKNQWIEKWIYWTDSYHFYEAISEVRLKERKKTSNFDEIFVYNPILKPCWFVFPIKLAVVVYNIKNELANVGELTNNQIRRWMVSELRYLGNIVICELGYRGWEHEKFLSRIFFSGNVLFILFIIL